MDDNSLFSGGGSDDGTFVPFTDILFNALLGFAVMVFIAFALIKEEAKTGTVDIRAEMLITSTWPDNHPDDIDLYVMDPLGNVAWYHSPAAGFLSLDRDDRGNYLNSIEVNGKTISSPLRQETVSVRGLVAGEYVVNVYAFTNDSKQPVPVTVKVEKINPKLKVVYYDTVTLTHEGDEKTIVRFTVDADGGISDINTRPISLIREVRK